jgi:hypothetical protein
MQAIAAQGPLQVPAHSFPLMHQTLPGAQQVPLQRKSNV